MRVKLPINTSSDDLAQEARLQFKIYSTEGLISMRNMFAGVITRTLLNADTLLDDPVRPHLMLCLTCDELSLRVHDMIDQATMGLSTMCRTVLIHDIKNYDTMPTPAGVSALDFLSACRSISTDSAA